MENQIGLKPISELLGMNFFIPRYQRGYRWGKQEVKELLDDIYQYAQSTCDRDSKIGKFYCLQPIVVKPRNTNDCIEFEIIDGQQRLTTLYIILTFLKETRKVLFSKDAEKLYGLIFETRKESESFLENKEFLENVDTSNVDFFHISNAYQYVKDWFEKHDDARGKVTQAILNKEYNVSVIWYEVKKDDRSESSSIELFTRLNQGKIPLTDAELIKALLLQSDRYSELEKRFAKQRLFEIASEWDEIESVLSDNKMWFFLKGIEDDSPTSKIELIYELLAEKWNSKRAYITFDKVKPRHYEYLVFDKYLESKRNGKFEIKEINDIWKEVKDIFSHFQYWYNNHTLFHYIGYLLACSDIKIQDLLKLSEELDKEAFEKELKKRIGEVVKISEKDGAGSLKKINELTYNVDNSRIIKILLLFNVDTLIMNKKENAKFPFHLYKEEKITSIEHIHPQNPETIDTDEGRAIVWLKSHRNLLSHLDIKNKTEEEMKEINELSKDIDSLITTFEKDKFEKCFKEMYELYSKNSEIKEDEVHTLYNLALVDKDTNSALNNSFFDKKREILKANKLGRYIPVCTQRAFSKYYSEAPNEMIFWANEDREAYFRAIKSVYESYTTEV